MRAYENYLFDLYGTLVDVLTDEERPEFWRAAAECFRSNGADYTADGLRREYLALCARETVLLAAARPELGEAHVEIDLRRVFRSLYAQKGADASDGRVDDTAVRFRRLSYLLAPRLYDGAAELLRTLRLRGAGVYLLSNAQSCFTLPELRELGILEAFDGIYISSDLGCKKPSAAFYSAALERAGISTEGALMVGNDDVADMRGAAQAGIDGAYIQTAISPPPRGALPVRCREIKSLADIL